jgi:hypothetical protein
VRSSRISEPNYRRVEAIANGFRAPASGKNVTTKPICPLYSINVHGNEPILKGSGTTLTALPGNKRRPMACRKPIQFSKNGGSVYEPASSYLGEITRFTVRSDQDVENIGCWHLNGRVTGTGRIRALTRTNEKVLKPGTIFFWG